MLSFHNQLSFWCKENCRYLVLTSVVANFNAFRILLYAEYLYFFIHLCFVTIHDLRCVVTIFI